MGAELMQSGNLSRPWETIQTLLTENEESVPDFRGIGQDVEVFEHLAQICLQTVLPRKVWLSNFDKKPLSEYVTVADEALANLVLEKNFHDWLKIAKKQVPDTKKRKRDTKYTLVCAKGSKGGAKKGWSTAGKGRYNDYFDSITEARKRDNVKTMEQVLLKKWKEGEDSINGLKELNETDESSGTIRFIPRSAFDYSKINFTVV